MKKISNKAKIRVIFLTLGCIITSVVFVSTLVSLDLQIKKTKDEIKELTVSYSDKLEEEENLKEEITRLQDPEYMAKYAREKYLYSKDNEIILKIEEWERLDMEEVYNFIKNKIGLEPNDTIVVGVSGGPDSMALL